MNTSTTSRSSSTEPGSVIRPPKITPANAARFFVHCCGRSSRSSGGSRLTPRSRQLLEQPQQAFPDRLAVRGRVGAHLLAAVREEPVVALAHHLVVRVAR